MNHGPYEKNYILLAKESIKSNMTVNFMDHLA